MNHTAAQENTNRPEMTEERFTELMELSQKKRLEKIDGKSWEDIENEFNQHYATAVAITNLLGSHDDPHDIPGDTILSAAISAAAAVERMNKSFEQLLAFIMIKEHERKDQ